MSFQFCNICCHFLPLLTLWLGGIKHYKWLCFAKRGLYFAELYDDFNTSLNKKVYPIPRWFPYIYVPIMGQISGHGKAEHRPIRFF